MASVTEKKGMGWVVLARPPRPPLRDLQKTSYREEAPAE